MNYDQFNGRNDFACASDMPRPRQAILLRPVALSLASLSASQASGACPNSQAAALMRFRKLKRMTLIRREYDSKTRAGPIKFMLNTKSPRQ